MTAHLKGREKALAAFGWTGRKAEWIALVCLHSGVFTRAQATRFLGTHHERARRMVRALIAQGVASERMESGVQDIGRVCRIFARRIYRALGAENIRHRRDASPEVLMRRLLSLDYVIDHGDLPWLPTEPEKVAAFDGLGIERRLLPSRLYRGAAGSTRRYFPVKLPVALDSGRAVFPYAEPGHRTAAALRAWGQAHRGLWHALRELDISVELVAVVRTAGEAERARTVTRGWAAAGPPRTPDPRLRQEVERIRRAILEGAVPVLDEYGGLQAAMKRSAALTKRLRRQPGPGSIQGVRTWRSARLAGTCYR